MSLSKGEDATFNADEAVNDDNFFSIDTLNHYMHSQKVAHEGFLVVVDSAAGSVVVVVVLPLGVVGVGVVAADTGRLKFVNTCDLDNPVILIRRSNAVNMFFIKLFQFSTAVCTF